MVDDFSTFVHQYSNCGLQANNKIQHAKYFTDNRFDKCHRVSLMLPSTHYMPFWRWLFPVNHLHWYQN